MTEAPKEQLQDLAVRLNDVYNVLYSNAQLQSVHTVFLSGVCGIVSKYTTLCARAADRSIDFVEESGDKLPMEDYDIQYLAEKLVMVFGRVNCLRIFDELAQDDAVQRLVRT